MWHLTCDTWHVTPDTWHLTYDTWWGVNIPSKFQVPNSYGLCVMMIRSFGGKGPLTELMNEWINDKGDCRTAPAKPGLLKKFWAIVHQVDPVVSKEKYTQY